MRVRFRVRVRVRVRNRVRVSRSARGITPPGETAPAEVQGVPAAGAALAA